MKMNWSLVVAVNSEEVLQGNLLRSTESTLANEIVILRQKKNASAAYNEGLAKSTGDVIVFAHQDVYLPPGWADQLTASIVKLTIKNPNWGVAGVYGVSSSGQGAGYVYSSGLRGFVGEPIFGSICVSTIDEMLLIIRRTAGLQFDEMLPGFHLYGTDICLEAGKRGMKNYIIPCFAVHNSCGITWLPFSFWKAYMYLRKKWRSRLPLITPCTKISVGCSAIFDHLLRNVYLNIRGQNKPGCRVPDPQMFYSENILPSLKISSNNKRIYNMK